MDVKAALQALFAFVEFVTQVPICLRHDLRISNIGSCSETKKLSDLKCEHICLKVSIEACV